MPHDGAHSNCLAAAAMARLASGRMAPVEAAMAEAHLATCRRCRVRFERERETERFIDLVRSQLGRGDVLPSPAAVACSARAGRGGREACEGLGELRGYRLLGEISRGGQGTVFRAVHEPTGRVVAVKVIRSGSTREQARLEREATLVARLRHPGIVTIHDCGRLPDGGLAIAMELVDGVPLDVWAARVDRASTDAAQTGRRKLELLAKLCDAVDHAHRRGVIHRDLKPRNVLVDDVDQPRVLDFGVAHEIQAIETTEATDAIEPDASGDDGAAVERRAQRPARSITRTGEFAGTLAYAAPEQLLGDSRAVDTRSDVYTIGVLLCELACGAMPYPVDGPLERVAHAVAHEAPKLPDRDVHGRRLDADLITIILHALAKDPERRYVSAAALGADLRRLLVGAPIDARRDSALYVLRKTVVRHKGAFAIGAGVAAMAIAGAVALSLAYRDTNTALKRVDAEAARLGDTLRATRLREAILLAEGGSLARAEELTWHEVLAPSSPAAVGAPSGDPEFLAALWALRQIHARSPCLASTVLGDGSRFTSLAVRDAAWVVDERGSVYRVELPDLRARRVAQIDLGAVAVDDHPLVFIDPVVGEVVVADRGSTTVRRFDLQSGRSIDTVALPADRRIVVAALAADGSAILGLRDGLALARRGADGIVLLDARVPAPSASMHVTSEGVVAYLTAEPALVVVDSATGELVASHRFAGWGSSLSIVLAGMADGTVLADMHGVVAFTPADGATRRVQACRDTLAWIAASPDGRRVASASISGTIRVNEMAEPEAVRLLAGHLHRENRIVGQLAFDRDGDRLLSAGGDGAIRLWRCDAAGWMRRSEAHALAVHTLAPSTDDDALVSIGFDNTVARTRDGQVARRDAIVDDGMVVFGAVSDDGRVIVHGERGSTASFVVRDAETLAPLLPPQECVPFAGPFAFSPDGRWLLAGAGSGDPSAGPRADELRLVDLRDGAVRALRAPGKHSGSRTVAFAPDGRLAAWGLRDGRIFLFDRDATTLPPSIGIGVAVRSVAFSPDGTRIVSAHENGHLVLWDVPAREKVAEQAVHADCAMAVRFSPDGTTIASATYGGEIGIWCAKRFRRLAMLRDDGTPIHSLAFSRDGRRLYLGTDSGAILTFDLRFHDRAIAANLEYWITMLEREGVVVTNAAPMRAWAQEVVGTREVDAQNGVTGLRPPK
ncbi:MAG: protein kinase [Phycisphaerales bacterium]